MNGTLLSTIGSSWMVVLLLAGSAGAVDADARCRNALGKGVLNLVDETVKRRADCFIDVMRGKSEGVDCNDLDDPEFPGAAKIERARNKLSDLAQRSCEGASSPQELGYLVCPEPCGAVSTTDYAGVASCLQCLVEDWTQDAIAETFGTPPTPAFPEQIRCQSRIGRALRRSMTTRIKVQQDCQLAEDRAETDRNCSVIDLDTDPRDRVVRTEAKLHAHIDRCKPPSLDSLDSCADDAAAEKQCVAALAEGRSDDVFTEVYLPIGLRSVFVSEASGRADGAGTFADPVDTIGAALAVAELEDKSLVLIDGGTYTESVTLASGIGLLGGFNAAAGWIRDGSIAAVQGGSTAVLGDGVTGVLLEQLQIEAAAGAAAGESSYGVRLIDSSDITIKDSSVQAGDGADGTSGGMGANGTDGVDGGDGDRGCESSTGFCGTCSRPDPGTGGTGAVCHGGTGGSGGAGGTPGKGTGMGTTGSDGTNGTGDGGSAIRGFGGDGGFGGDNDPGESGEDGSDGRPGAEGTAGAAAAEFGTGVTAYIGAAGSAGGAGGGGAGGGGGGGGGGTDLACDAYGGAGGGGGGGGCPGAGGEGGTGAGGSFAIWLANTDLVLEATAIGTGSGGSGGAGGLGGLGGLGGEGGDGGSGSNRDLVGDSGPGGDGGAGGIGGNGGSGGGGGGGPSIGVHCADGASLAASDNTFTLGPAGSGGGSSGNVGAAGRRSETNDCGS